MVFAYEFDGEVGEKLHSEEHATLCLFIFPHAYRSGMASIRNDHVRTYYKRAYANGQTRCHVAEFNSALAAKLSQEQWQVSFKHATMYHCKRA